jgi:autoinducer 2-degrading protein
MHVTLVQVRVKPDQVQAFLDASRRHHEGSVQESGNLRFDILQDAEDPTKFMLYEAYVSPDDATAHKATKHYLAWRDQVAKMMAKPPKATVYNGLFPRV